MTSANSSSDHSGKIDTYLVTNNYNITSKNNIQNNILEILDKLEAHLLNKNVNANTLYQIFSNMLEETIRNFFNDKNKIIFRREVATKKMSYFFFMY